MSPTMAHWQMERGIPVFVNVYHDASVGAAHTTRYRAEKAAQFDSIVRKKTLIGRLRLKLKGVPDHPVIKEMRTVQR